MKIPSQLMIEDLAALIDKEPKDSQDRILTGDAALEEAGMQAEFAAHLVLHFSHFGAGVTLRVGTTPSYDAKRVAKPGTILTKTSNHGLVKGLIPTIPALTKIDANRNPIGLHEADQKKLSDGDQLTVPLSLSLREILASAGKDGDMTIRFDKEKNRLVLQYRNGKGPEGCSGKFYIDLDKGRDIERRYSRPWNEPQEDPDNPDKFLNVEKPEGLDEEIFEQLLNKINNDFPVDYEPDIEGAKATPLMVFAASNPENPDELLPITGDWDFLVMGHPPDLPNYAYKTFNTFPRKTDPPEAATEKEKKAALIESANNIRHLTDRTKRLFEDLKKKALKKSPVERDLFEQYLSKDKVTYNEIFTIKALNSAGSITPFEFLQALMINYAYQDKNRELYGELYGKSDLPFDANIINLIQHGAENRSPYKPSDLNGKMLHFYQGIPVLTKNEDQLVNFYLTGDYLENTRIDVHPGWSMEKWAPVIERQKALKQSISATTLKVYENYQYMKKALAKQPLPASDKKLYAAIEYNKKNYQPIPEQLEPWYAQNHIRKLPTNSPFGPMLSFSTPKKYTGYPQNPEEKRGLLDPDYDRHDIKFK
jgi:hypothetical protein